MLLRCVLAVLLVSFISTIDSANDDDTSKWVQQTFNNSTEEENESIDLSPTTDEKNDNQCLTDKREIGECVVYYLCDPDTYTIIEDGSTLIDVRQKQCLSYLEVCCAHKALIPEPETTKSPALTLPPQSDVKEVVVTTPLTTTSKLNEDKMFTPAFQEDMSSQCGWEESDLFFFPRNDSVIYANFGEYPWAVALIKKKRTTVWSPNDYLGGGALLHPSVVLTVAHKVDNKKPTKIKIRAGEWDTQTVKERYPFQERDVKKIIVHPDYFATSVYYDAALLILETPFNLESAPHIKPACIGKSLPPPGTICYSMGWGPDFNNDEKYTTILKKIRLPLVAPDDCTEKLQQSRLGQYFRLHKSLTCAGGKKDIDTCQGDGGSSLVCPIENKDKQIRYAVYGLVAYGIDCGEEDRPGVYVNIPEISQWIDEEMTKEKFGTKTYTV